MKRVLMTFLAAVLLVTASTAQSLKFQSFADSVGVKQKGVPISSSVKVDFPVSGPSALVNALKATFSERYKIPVAQITDGKTFANKLANKNVADLKKKFVEDFEEDDMIPELYINNTIEKLYETDKIVTIAYGGNIFYGGAHDDYYGYGITYNKSTGKALDTYDILNEDAWEQIQDKIAAGLRKYFDVKTNKELADELSGEGIICDNNNFYIPMPEAIPFVNNGELIFTYGTYEIAPFAAGMPEVSIPLKDIQQYLKAEFKELVK
ncbi:MAG: DUF3298 domain-containing protein [Bacteroidales bacterium]|nr:DUF3298 domain-containing protein [Bacteroidales bacterium]